MSIKALAEKLSDESDIRDVKLLATALLKVLEDNERLYESLKTYGRHSTINHVCEFSKHSERPCTCYLNKSFKYHEKLMEELGGE